MKGLEKAAFFAPLKKERKTGNKVKAFTDNSEEQMRVFVRQLHKKGTFYSLSCFEGEILHKIMKEMQLDLFANVGEKFNKLYLIKY